MLLSDIATIVTAAVALVLALYTLLATRRNERDLERLKAELAEKQADRDARRDYEYEARKRLYTEFEPLFFQFVEAARGARGRIYGLARSARKSSLDPGTSWLSQPDGYYMLTTAYNVFAPLALARLIQRRLTFIDLSLDPKIRNQYEVLRRLVRIFAHDYEIAGQEPRLSYDPNHRDAEALSRNQPEVYHLQAIFAGYLDMVLEASLVSEKDGPQRCMSFGEFVRLQQEHPEEFHRDFGLIIGLFLHFHPRTRPVLWRMLIAQCILYRWIFSSVNSPEPVLTAEALREPEGERRESDWRKPGDSTPDTQVLVEPFVAAEAYLARQFAS